MAQAKHLGAYTQENARARINQVVSQRVMTEIYNAPFQAAVTQAHVASIMCAMGTLNGVNTCSTSQFYATLRSWGFTGFVRSDYDAVDVARAGLPSGDEPTEARDRCTGHDIDEHRPTSGGHPSHGCA